MGISPAGLVRLLMLAGHGATTPSEHSANLDALVAALLHPGTQRARHVR